VNISKTERREKNLFIAYRIISPLPSSSQAGIPPVPVLARKERSVSKDRFSIFGCLYSFLLFIIYKDK
jgi:hypothetical protein